MSLAYDEYLIEHIKNVNHGLHWMLDNLSLNQDEKDALETAMLEFSHDASKYSEQEYDAYDKYFYGGNRTHQVVQDFKYAWLHHQRLNPHHWQYWVLINDDPGEDSDGTPHEYKFGNVVGLKIPLNYIFEMVADWWSFSWKTGKLFEIFDWYDAHKAYQIIHPESRQILEDILKRIATQLEYLAVLDGEDPETIARRYRKPWMNPDHLEHSGRLGQKWGVRNGPPYPLDSDTVKEEYGSDAKVMESNKTDDSNGSDKPAEKKHRTTKVSSVKKELTAQIRELKNEYKKAAADENADPEYLELLDMEINELKEEADARQRMAKQNHPDEYYTPVSKRLLELEPVEKLEDLKKLDPNSNIEKARMNINHPDGDNMIGRDYNCPNCAAAFELTERGYDVIARRKKPGSNVENVEDFFKGGKLQNVGGETEIPPYPEMIEKFSLLPTVKKHQQELNSTMRKQFWNSIDVAMKEAEANIKQYGEKQGIGARGLFVVGWIEDPKMAKRTTAFHAMNYKVVAGSNGQPEIKIFDTQSKWRFKQNGDVELQSVLYDADPRDIYMMRTDTLELSDKITQAVYSNRRG